MATLRKVTKMEMKKLFSQTIWFIAALLSFSQLTHSTVLPSPLEIVKNDFPGTIKIDETEKKSVEFCPDNTCDLFTADEKVPFTNLEDFAYLYIYFFSDYYVLKEWRNKKVVRLSTSQILKKSNYKFCKNLNDKEMARCLLRHLSHNGQIKLYMVRYDENNRNIVRINVVKATR